MAGAGLERDMWFSASSGARAGYEQAHVGGQVGIQPRVAEQPGIEGRNPHHRRRPRHGRDDRIQVEARHELHRSTGYEADVHRDEQAVGVEDRQGMDQHVSGGEAPEVGQGACVRQQIVVRQHRPFRSARGAGGVQDRGKVASLAVDRLEGSGLTGGRLGEAPASVRVQGAQGRAVRTGDRVQRRLRIGTADQQLRLRIADEIGDFIRRVCRVERQQDGAGHHAGGIQHQHLRRLGGLHRHAVSLAHADCGEGAGISRGRGGKGLVGQGLAGLQIQERPPA